MLKFLTMFSFHNLKGVIFLEIVLSMFPFCRPKTSRNTPGEIPQSQNSKVISNSAVPDFNADSTYVFIEKQVSFGPRIPGTTSQTKCAEWLTAKLKSYNAKVVVQDLDLE